MANTIQVRRGLKVSLPTLAVGQFGWCTDTEELFMGTGSGNIYIGGSDVMTGPASAVNNRIAVFDGTTGKLLKDGGATISELLKTTVSETAGEAVSAGDICYRKSDGKMWKARANAETTTKGELFIATEAISADSSGTFGGYGYEYTTSGLTVGPPYFLSSATGGAITTTAPSGGNMVRIVGYAKSATVFRFIPSQDWGETSA